ncbi:uncharacterized protein LOC127129622 [Lathyrus oleraceus]|uniref:uncharacterized protein LOC127129622 n=1 Tax=Pisum sativum TaxID=3888 RepID=UPI0021D38828|nr:uncharacterized protein LOC127129622 [Pisum sativum]
MGNVKVKVKNGKTALIKDVWYVPGMKINLMNVGHLIKKGFSVIMKDNLLKLYDSDQKLIMQTEQGSNRIFKVNVEATETKCLSVEGVKGDCELWHKRSGHPNFRSLRYLSYKKLVHEIPKIVKPKKSCVICMKASLGENNYFVPFKDEFIRMTWISLIKFKYEVFVKFQKFKKFKVKAEKQSGQKLKILIIDGGDSESENEPESEGDTDAKVESDFEGEFDDLDSDNDSDSEDDPDSEDDLDSGGNLASKGRPSEGTPSKVIVSEGGSASETRP